MGYYNVYNSPKRPQVNRIDAMKTVLQNSFFSHEKEVSFYFSFPAFIFQTNFKIKSHKKIKVNDF